jgi:c-di-GMP-binding flagellar brake protein YcgR
MSSSPVEQNDFESDSTLEDLDAPATTAESVSNAPQGSFPFEAMNLKVGDRLQAQAPAKVSTERCFVRLIGYLHGQSLLVTIPKTSNGTPLQLIEGDQLVMRVFSSKNAFGFACDVQKVYKLPFSYMHISFPREVQGTLIRKAARVRTKIIANVRTQQAGSPDLTGVISNLSANGALLDGRREMAKAGDQLQLDFRLKLHNVEASLSLTAVVRAVLDDETLRQSGTTLAHFGLEFVDLQPNDQMLLQSMVYQKMIEDPQSLA